MQGWSTTVDVLTKRSGEYLGSEGLMGATPAARWKSCKSREGIASLDKPVDHCGVLSCFEGVGGDSNPQDSICNTSISNSRLEGFPNSHHSHLLLHATSWMNQSALRKHHSCFVTIPEHETQKTILSILTHLTTIQSSKNSFNTLLTLFLQLTE